MKKVTALVVCCLVYLACSTPPKNETNCDQTIAQPVSLQPQWYPTSCWAASLSMAAQYLRPCTDSLNQCYFIAKNEDSSRCCCSQTGDMVDSFSECEGSDCIDGSAATDIGKVRDLAKKWIVTTASLKYGPIGLNQLRQCLDQKIPIIYDYPIFDNGYSHVTFIPAREEVEFSQGKKSTFLYVQDPWPIGEGSKHYLTYQGYSTEDVQNNIILGTPEGEPIDEPIPLNNLALEGSESSALRQTFFDHIKQIDRENNKAFLDSIGLIAQQIDFSKLKLSTAQYRVKFEEVKSFRISNNGDSLIVYLLRNFKKFEQFTSFILNEDNAICTVFTIAHIKKNDNSWWIQSIENGKPYQLDNLVLTVQSSLQRQRIILKLDGALNGEILAIGSDSLTNLRVQKISRKLSGANGNLGAKIRNVKLIYL